MKRRKYWSEIKYHKRYTVQFTGPH
jgi:hypothetical protein